VKLRRQAPSSRAAIRALPPATAAAWRRGGVAAWRPWITVGGEGVKRFTFTNPSIASADRLRSGTGDGQQRVEVFADVRRVLRDVAAALEPLSAAACPASTWRLP
jgi:hypothetical protein